MKRLVLGVIGHVDHGKTALVRALTGQETDRLPEERARGISIALGFAHLRLPDGTMVDLIDMPGHERFVPTMVSGATGIDAVLLVIAANVGIQAQTVEHADVAALLGLKRAIVVITKADLATAEDARERAAMAMRLLVERGFSTPKVITTSTKDTTGLSDLVAAIGELAGETAVPAVEGTVYLPIDRAFSIPGHGPVVTGTLRGAAVGTGERLTLFPKGQSVQVRAVQVHGERVGSAEPGQRVALNLRGIAVGDLARGMALAAPCSIDLAPWLNVLAESAGGAPPLRNGMRLRALLGTAEVDVRLRLLDRDVLEAGEQALAQLHCDAALAIPAREHFVLRLPSPARTVAGGVILETGERRLKRKHALVLQRLASLNGAAPAAIIESEIGHEGSTSMDALSRLTALARWRVAELLAELPVVITRSNAVLNTAALDRMMVRALKLLAKEPAGIAADAVRSDDALRDEALARLLASGTVVRRGHLYRLARPAEDRLRASGEASLAARLTATMREAGLTPPTPRELTADPATARAAERLLKDGTLVRAVDRAKGKELLFHADAIADARRRLAPLLDDGEGLLVTEIAAALGISRKFVMPLLDHLDSIRFTVRVGDRRRLYLPATAVQQVGS